MTSPKKSEFNHFNASMKPEETLGGIIAIHSTETLIPQSDFVGISSSTAGSRGIAMNWSTIPPGASAKPHFHPNHETAIYLIKGRLKICHGADLKQITVVEAGDFIFVPPGVPHQPFNLSADEPVYAIVARTDPNEQEEVVLYDPYSDR